MAWYECLYGGSELTETELWSNQSPTSSFASQTVTLNDDVDNYQFIRIYYRVRTDNVTEYSTMCTTGNFKAYSSSGSSSSPRIAFSLTSKWSTLNLRQIYDYNSTTRQVTFGNAWQSSSSSTATNTYTIPTKITGIKFDSSGTGSRDYQVIGLPQMQATQTFIEDYDNILCIISNISSTGYTPNLTTTVNLTSGSYETLVDNVLVTDQGSGGRLRQTILSLKGVKSGDSISCTSAKGTAIFTLVK